MLSSTFNSPNALCYCHPHFKEKLIERFAADGLRNLPDPRASKQKSQNSKLKSSASKSVRWPQWCCRFSVSRRLPEDSGQRLWTTLMEDFIGTFGMNIWLSGQTDQLSSPYLSSANCETEDQNSCHLPPACSPEWDKSSQLLYKKHFFSCQILCLLSSLKDSRSYKRWDSPLLSWTLCNGHPVLTSWLPPPPWPSHPQARNSKFRTCA